MAIRRAVVADADSIAEVYLASFQAALPEVRLAHSNDDVHRWVKEHLVPQTETWVAVDGEEVVGMLSLSPGWINQLYVAPQRLGQGIGRRLLAVAKERSDGLLELWTFQVNQRARRFYERNGFVAAELTDGASNEEREPDIRYRWHPSSSGSEIDRI